MILLMVFLFLFLYFLLGLSLSRFFTGTLRNNVFFHLFISFLLLPLFYTMLISFKALNLWNFLILEIIFGLTCFWVSKRVRKESLVNTDDLSPPFRASRILLGFSFIFFLMVMSPRLGLLSGFFPIGDDQHQIRKIVSIAESPADPLFYHFPTTRLTIYYFNNVAPGLLVKFSDNFIKANQAWFIHVGLLTVLLLWLIIRIGGSLFGNNLQRFVLFFFLTFFSGLEYYLYKFKGLTYVNQLEWWSDWFLPQSRLHTQISNPFNLFFWVPQHLLAGLYVLVIYLVLRSPQRTKMVSKVFLALLWAGILGNSAFIFISLIVVYALCTLTKILQEKNLIGQIKFNLPVMILALIFSLKNLELFITAEKGHYFVPMANVFWFLPNVTFLGKFVNLFLTIPLYFLVEFGVLFIVLIWALLKFVREEEFRRKYLFFYFYLLLLPLIFFIKTLDDNNISMRSFIPLQIGLGIFVAELVGRLPKSKKFYVIFLLFMLMSLPSGISDFYRRLSEQFDPASSEPQGFYERIDNELPLNSIVLSPFGQEDKITALGHRFTFKSVTLFNATDREHTAASKIRDFEGLQLWEASGIRKVLLSNPSLSKDYHFYSLTRFDEDWIESGNRLFEEGGLSVSPLKIKF